MPGSRRIVLAQYPGRCPRCPREIKVGDPIVLADEEWVHNACEQAEPGASSNPLCTLCFIQHPPTAECA